MKQELESLKMRKKVALVIGTRPEAIKLMPVFRALNKAEIPVSLISTGQQRDLLALTLKDLDLSVDYELNLMMDSPTKTSFLTRATESLGELFASEKFGFVVVQGDTFSALAGAIAGYLHGIPIGHVEAGLRSGDLNSPWPEEGIRRMIDGVATLLWAPTRKDLIPVAQDQKITVTGNTVVDAIRLILGRNKKSSHESIDIIITLHRRESFGKTLSSALKNLSELSAKHSDYNFVFIKHPNPAVREAIDESGLEKSRVRIINPIAYTDFITYLDTSKLIITDSGGLQEEAHVLGIPMIVLRETTERSDAISVGRSTLSAPDGSSLEKDFTDLIGTSRETGGNIAFGHGFASEQIAEQISEFLKDKKT